MTNMTERRMLSKLAKIDTTGMKHTQKLDAFAKALGERDQTALMGGLKRKEKAVKVRRQDIPPDIEATAFIRSDDGAVQEVVDIHPYLRTISAEDYAQLVETDFAPGRISDEAFYAVEHNNPGAKRLSDFLSFGFTDMSGDPIGFHVRINGEQAEAWLRAHRPEIIGDPVMVEVRSHTWDKITDIDIRPLLKRIPQDVVEEQYAQESGYTPAFTEQLLNFCAEVSPAVQQAKVDAAREADPEAGLSTVSVNLWGAVAPDSMRWWLETFRPEITLHPPHEPHF